MSDGNTTVSRKHFVNVELLVVNVGSIHRPLIFALDRKVFDARYLGAEAEQINLSAKRRKDEQ